MTRALTMVFGGPYDRILDVPQAALEAGLQIENRLFGSPKDAFAALRDDEGVAGGEMSVSFYMTEQSRTGTANDLVALPVWISRSFRHGNVWVRSDSELTSLDELRDRRIGLPEYGMTMAVWLRGLLSDDYGIQPSDIRWLTHRPPAGLRNEAVTYPSDVEIVNAPAGRSPQQSLLDGDVDAWIGAGVAPPAPGVRRLLADPAAAEREYFARTSIFPIMHVLVLKRQLIEDDPGLAEVVFHAFDESKARAQRRLWSTSVSYTTLPWALAAAEEQARFMGGDPWPYGIRANLPTLQTLARYMDEQHLLWGKLPLDNYFLPLEPRDHH